MRTVCCTCGQHLIAPEDTELFHHYQRHIRTAHPEDPLTDLQLYNVFAHVVSDLTQSHAQSMRSPLAQANDDQAEELA